MPECIGCDTFIRSGARCQQCRNEHLFGTSIGDDSDDEWRVKQAGLGGEPARGQTTLEGYVVPEDRP